MSNGQENNTNCEIHKFERNNYFYGKLMTVRDFETEQSYFNEKRHLLNRLVSGSGLVCGLSVDKIQLADTEGYIKITFPDGGVALDCCGQEIVVPAGSEKLILTADGTNLIKANMSKNLYLYLSYNPCPGQKVAAASNPSSCEETCCSNRIIEDFAVIALDSPPDSKTVACPDFSAATTGTEAESILKAWWLDNVTGSCSSCTDPSVFIAVLKSDGTIDAGETKGIAYTVHNNKLLSSLLKCHVTDFNNPHKTTAAQVKALKTVNGVGNVNDNVYVSNVDLVSTKSTITRVNDLTNNCIDLNTIPSTIVKSVEETPYAGSSPKFSPGDHVHDLADGVVTTPKIRDGAVDENKLGLDAVYRRHLNDDVIDHLIDSDNTITITPDPAGKRITVRTNPATEVTSVGTGKVIGISKNFAPEDHVHDLADGVVTTPKIIDGAVDEHKLGPDAVYRRHLNNDVIHNLLDSDGSIIIESDDTNKKISIKTARVGASNSGVVIFPSDAFQAVSDRMQAVSDWIDPKLGRGRICVILGIEQGEIEEIFIGHVEVSSIFQFPQMFLAAMVDPRRGIFRIGVIQNPSEYIESVRVRWWAFLPGNDLGEVTVVTVKIEPPSIALQPGEKFQFSATVSGITDQTVVWSVLQADGGKIADDGTYVAPDIPGTYQIEATSKADPTKTAIATVTVMSVISVSISPASTTVDINKGIQFTADVSGTSNTAVTWSVQDGGSINTTGLYIAPGTPGTYHVIVTSVADSTKTATATIDVTSQINVAVNPPAAVLKPSASQDFSATVTGTTNTAVAWKLIEPNGGSVTLLPTGSGTYTAPQTEGTYHVMAISREDKSKTATATVAVVSGEIKYVPYVVFRNTERIVENGMCQDGTKNCIKQGTIAGGGFYAMMGTTVALNGVPGKLAELILEQPATDVKTLAVGDSWDIGGGWTLTPQSIDAKAQPQQVWLVLSYQGAKIDDVILNPGSVYTHTQKQLAGETDVPVFVTHIAAISAGATSDMVQLNYTWAISMQTVISKLFTVGRKKKTGGK